MGLANRSTFDPLMGGGGVGAGGGASNNANYTGGGFAPNAQNIASSNTSTIGTITGPGGIALGEIMSVGGETISRLNVVNSVLNTAKDAYDYFTQDEKDKMSDAERSVVDQAEALQKAQEEQAKGQQSLEDDLNNILEGIKYNEGDVLPDVFSRNAKALSTSINSLTSVLSEQLGLLNNNMMAMLIYQDQFLDIETKKLSVLSNMKGSSTDLSPLVSHVASISPAVQSLSNSISGISPNTSLEKINKTIGALKFETAPINLSTAPITLDTTALATQFSKVSPSLDAISKAIEANKLNIDPLNKSIIGVNGALDKLVELKKTDNEQVKDHYEKRSEEIELNVDSLKFDKDPVSSSFLETDNVSGMSPREIVVSKHSNDIEAKVYARTPQEIKDLDGETVLETSPRDATLVKDATVAKDHTDKINFVIPPELQSDLDEDNLSIEDILGYDDGSEIFKIMYRELGGLGL